jgi:peroxiredoxin
MKHFLISLSIIFIFSNFLSAQEDYKYKTNIGESVPDFEFTTTDGDKFNISDLKGNVVLINFFATWCPPCIKEFPKLQSEVWEKLKDENFKLIAIGREHSMEEVTKFKNDKKVLFPIAPDPERTIYSLFADQNIPRNYLLDAQGKIIYQEVGYTEEEFNSLVELIEKTIKSTDQTSTN